MGNYRDDPNGANGRPLTALVLNGRPLGLEDSMVAADLNKISKSAVVRVFSESNGAVGCHTKYRQ